MGKHLYGISGGNTFLDGKLFVAKGLRCSNGLFSDTSTDELIENLDIYKNHGLNTVSAYFMGNRFGDIKGYNSDCTLNEICKERMARIIEAADSRGMVVLVGCLYWGKSKSVWDEWTQAEACEAIKNTVKWLQQKDYRNVFVDVDNEGMACKAKGFDIRALVLAAKAFDPTYRIAANMLGIPPKEADLGIHFSDKVPDKPYIETEGVAEAAPGGYWSKFSRAEDVNNPYRISNYYNYINVGVYTNEMKADQINRTRRHIETGWGYLMASTWLQAVPPYGPNHNPGGYGTPDDPGIRWWLEFIKNTYGPYEP